MYNCGAWCKEFSLCWPIWDASSPSVMYAGSIKFNHHATHIKLYRRCNIWHRKSFEWCSFNFLNKLFSLLSFKLKVSVTFSQVFLHLNKFLHFKWLDFYGEETFNPLKTFRTSCKCISICKFVFKSHQKISFTDLEVAFIILNFSAVKSKL